MTVVSRTCSAFNGNAGRCQASEKMPPEWDWTTEHNVTGDVQFTPKDCEEVKILPNIFINKDILTFLIMNRIYSRACHHTLQNKLYLYISILTLSGKIDQLCYFMQHIKQ